MSLRKKNPYKKPNPLNPERNFKNYIKFIFIAVVLVVLIEFVVFKDGRPYLKIYQMQYADEMEAIQSVLPPKIVYPDDGAQYFEAPKESLKLSETDSILPEKQLNLLNEKEYVGVIDGEQKSQQESILKPQVKPQIKKKAQTTLSKITKEPRPNFSGKTAYIAIVIDDVGMNVKQSYAAIALPSEVTMAMLPYAPKVKSMAKQARAEGHELIIHTPMEAMNKDVPLGDLALRSNMNEMQIKAEFNKIANSFDGYVGVNNHMGSRLTQDDEAMAHLMGELKRRNLFFLDSKTIGGSVAADWAHRKDIPYAIRDVFLDHEGTPEFVSEALRKAERMALKNGSAIAIGHPKAVTIEALNKWIPTLAAKNIRLVPVSHLLRNKSGVSKMAEIKSSPDIHEIVDVPLEERFMIVNEITADIKKPIKIEMVKEAVEIKNSNVVSYPIH